MTSVRFKAVLGRQRDGRVSDRVPVAGPGQPSDPPVSRTARLLALGYKVRRLLDAGVLPDQTEAAARLGLSIPHLSHIVALTYLSPRIQEAVLSGAHILGEHPMRRLAQDVDWTMQEGHLLR